MAEVYPRVCGGNADAHLCAACLVGLSPRVRGNVCMSSSTSVNSGLSPRVRGKQVAPRSRLDVLGSIPACAGETILSASSRKNILVYPRVCGGNTPFCGGRRWGCGLSPRVRGKRFQRILLKEWGGVYPRVCGGNGSCFPDRYGTQGLSPRVRGKRLSGLRCGMC